MTHRPGARPARPLAESTDELRTRIEQFLAEMATEFLPGTQLTFVARYAPDPLKGGLLVSSERDLSDLVREILRLKHKEGPTE